MALYFTHQVAETALTFLNMAHTRKHQGKIPAYFKDKMDGERYQKSIRYTLERSWFGVVIRWLKVPFLWAVILWGGFSALDGFLSSYLDSSTLIFSVAYCLAIGFILLLTGIPVSLYSNFVIEKKFGFNKMTAKLFFLDQLKMLALGAAFGLPILFLIFWLYEVSGPLWWLWAFLSVFGFELFVAAVYPTFLAPLFNKFTPLPNGELKNRILELAQKIRFKLSGIFTIDGSKRSSHSNAYFAGIGRFRRIVLFDTLQSQLSESEIVAVLGHEMGHNKKRHIQKHLILSFVIEGIGFWILSLAIEWEPLYGAFRAGSLAPYKALVLFSLFGGHFTFFLTPLSNYLSRKHEYEADRFSVEVVGDKASMASSLVKLSKENLSNLTPHPLYSFYYYSHPTTLERVQAIENT